MAAGLETFAKIRALHDNTSIPGEKAAAAAKMESLARNAGMTVEEAVSKLDTPKPAAFDILNEFFNKPEFREHRAEAEREGVAKRAALIVEYGSEEALYADTPQEAA